MPLKEHLGIWLHWFRKSIEIQVFLKYDCIQVTREWQRRIYNPNEHIQGTTKVLQASRKHNRETSLTSMWQGWSGKTQREGCGAETPGGNGRGKRSHLRWKDACRTHDRVDGRGNVTPSNRLYRRPRDYGERLGEMRRNTHVIRRDMKAWKIKEELAPERERLKGLGKTRTGRPRRKIHVIRRAHKSTESTFITHQTRSLSDPYWPLAFSSFLQRG